MLASWRQPEGARVWYSCNWAVYRRIQGRHRRKTPLLDRARREEQIAIAVSFSEHPAFTSTQQPLLTPSPHLHRFWEWSACSIHHPKSSCLAESHSPGLCQGGLASASHLSICHEVMGPDAMILVF